MICINVKFPIEYYSFLIFIPEGLEVRVFNFDFRKNVQKHINNWFYPHYKLLWTYISVLGFGLFNWFPTQYMFWGRIMALIICKDTCFLLSIILLILVGKGLSCRSVGLESSTSLHERKFNPPTFVKSFFTVSLFLPFICPLKYQIFCLAWMLYLKVKCYIILAHHCPVS